MLEYPKIQTIYKRDMKIPGRPLREGDWTMPEFEFLAKNDWVFTEKVDGTNIRLIYSPKLCLKIAGRTDKSNVPDALLKNIQKLGIQNKCAKIFDSPVVLYGEGYGGNIQKGQKYRSDPGFVLFDVNIGGWWLNRLDVEDIADQLDMAVVPIIGTGTLFDAVYAVKKTFCSRWGDFEAEGIVAQPAVELKFRDGNRIITKIKCRDFRVLNDHGAPK